MNRAARRAAAATGADPPPWVPPSPAAVTEEPDETQLLAQLVELFRGILETNLVMVGQLKEILEALEHGNGLLEDVAEALGVELEDEPGDDTDENEEEGST